MDDKLCKFFLFFKAEKLIFEVKQKKQWIFISSTTQ